MRTPGWKEQKLGKKQKGQTRKKEWKETRNEGHHDGQKDGRLDKVFFSRTSSDQIPKKEDCVKTLRMLPLIFVLV